MSKNENNNLKKYLKITLIILCGVIGVFLIMGGELFLSADEKERETTQTQVYLDADEYAKQVEQKVIRLCSGVKGVGNVSAVVTLSGGYNAVYAQNSQSTGAGYKNEFVMVGSGSKEAPLLIGYTPPDISGIGIICAGGGEEYVRCELISLVCATFGVSANKIYVAEAES